MKNKYSIIFIIIVLLVILPITLMSCKKESQKNNKSFDYDSLYNSVKTEKYKEDLNRTTTKSEYGYTKNTINGYNNWFYYGKIDQTYEEMQYNNKTNSFEYQKAKFNNGTLTSTNNVSATISYKITTPGKVTIYGNPKQANLTSAATIIEIYHNNKLVYNVLIKEKDLTGKYFNLELNVSENDSIYFVNKNNSEIYLNPVITYEKDYDESLYHLTSFDTCYGDVFPYYDTKQNKLYMGFLWSNDARIDNNYHFAIEESNNLLTYKNVPEENNYDIWQNYNQNYKLDTIFNPNNFIDKTKYTFGARDNMIYRENDRYLLIAGCYYEFNGTKQTSDLVIYGSDDKFALSWTKKGNVIASYSKNLPECPTLIKIGNRYYVAVSVAYNTAHQVGPLQYWVGDENVDCLDVDWQSKEFSYLDGEDLCAARLTYIKDKVYMWGWIPYTYNTMPWSPWGGYLNLPREVIQLKDGTLGTRMDEGLYKKINYGNIFNLEENSYQVEQGSASYNNQIISLNGTDNKIKLGKFKRNLVEFTLNLKDSTKAGYLMKQNNSEYYCNIVKENNHTYLEVSSPNDSLHKINSRLEIPNYTTFNIKIVIDNGKIEFYVNDEKTLTAITSVNNDYYEGYLYSNKTSTYQNVKVNKLISYSDIE